MCAFLPGPKCHESAALCPIPSGTAESTSSEGGPREHPGWAKSPLPRAALWLGQVLWNGSPTSPHLLAPAAGGVLSDRPWHQHRGLLCHLPGPQCHREWVPLGELVWAVELPPAERGRAPDPCPRAPPYPLCLQIPVGPESSAVMEAVRVRSGHVTHGDVARTAAMTAAAAPCSHPQVRSRPRALWAGPRRREEAGGRFVETPLAPFITARPVLPDGGTPQSPGRDSHPVVTMVLNVTAKASGNLGVNGGGFKNQSSLFTQKAPLHSPPQRGR